MYLGLGRVHRWTLTTEHRQHVSDGLQRLARDQPEVWADRNRRIAEGNRKPKKNSRTAEMAATALRLRAEGATQVVIAKELGVSQPRVSALLRAAASPA